MIRNVGSYSEYIACVASVRHVVCAGREIFSRKSLSHHSDFGVPSTFSSAITTLSAALSA